MLSGAGGEWRLGICRGTKPGVGGGSGDGGNNIGNGIKNRSKCGTFCLLVLHE